LSDRLHFNCLSIDVNWNGPLHLDRDRNLDRFIDDSVNELDLPLFDWDSHNLVYMHSDWDLVLLYNYSLLSHLLNLHIGSCLKVLYQDLVSWNLHCPINIQIHYSLHFNLHRPIDVEVLRNIMLHWRHLDWDLDDLLYYLLNDLRHFHNSFNNPGDNYYPLHNLLNFHALRDLYYLLDDLLFNGGHFFNLLEIHLLRNDFFFLHHDGHFFPHDKRHILNDLDRLFFSQYDMLNDLHWDVLLHVDCLNERNLMDFCLYLSLRHNYRHLNVLLNLPYLHSGLINNPRHLHLHYLNLLHNLQHFPNHFYFSWRQLDYLFDSNNFLNDLWDLDNPLFNVNDWYNFLHYFFYYFNPGFNVGHVLRYFLISDNFDNLLYDLRDGDNLFSLYDFLDYFFDDDLDWLDDLFFSLHISHYFLYDLHHFNLFLNHYLLDLNHHCLLHLHNLLD
jgi:hypothetical protein